MLFYIFPFSPLASCGAYTAVTDTASVAARTAMVRIVSKRPLPMYTHPRYLHDTPCISKMHCQQCHLLDLPASAGHSVPVGASGEEREEDMSGVNFNACLASLGLPPTDGSFAQTSSHAFKASDDATKLIEAALVPTHAKDVIILENVIPPTVHIVDNLWGTLSKSFKEKRGVVLKRRKATDAERISFKIKTTRPRFFISAHILPISKHKTMPAPAAAAVAASASGTGSLLSAAALPVAAAAAPAALASLSVAPAAFVATVTAPGSTLLASSVRVATASSKKRRRVSEKDGDYAIVEERAAPVDDEEDDA